ncbi:MAG TPA: hypothetical protein VKB79_15160 [Bryobacteraceae bacterium]|nr:hypothetical protein [Bryobacteraceae bacterium]
MRRFAPAEPTINFTVQDSHEQEVLITVIGSDVLEFEGNRQGPPARGQRPLRDPIEVVVDAARRGMFANPDTPPWTSTAELRSKDVSAVQTRQTWRVGFKHVDLGVFRVVMNILRSRFLDRIDISTIAPEAGMGRSQIDLWNLRYPSIRQSTPFLLDYEMPDRTCRDRYLQIGFAKPLSNGITKAVFDALDNWTWLLMLGGYPGDNIHPTQSSAAPEPAFLVDPNTIEQAFPDLFLCDDDCYAAVINYAQIVHRSVWPIEALLIR